MELTIRPASDADRADLGRMAAGLVRLHHALDARRFFLIEPIEDGYGRWLAREARNPRAVVLVAVAGDAIVGYVYGALIERDWSMLLDACAALHDIWVDDAARRTGVARKLAEAFLARMTERGAPRVVLSTAATNEPAQRFFDALGFRRTMVEMTREL
jgi:ribosomal protein S18 acetylase RimI-like enzyme